MIFTSKNNIMSIQVNITSNITKRKFQDISWFSNNGLDGGINGVDLVLQKEAIAKKNYAIIELEDKRLAQQYVQEISAVTLNKIARNLKNDDDQKLFEIVPCDKLMKLFIPLIVPITQSKKEPHRVISIAKKLFETAFKIAFKTDNIPFNCKVKRLDEDHVLLVTQYNVTWQMIASFWNILQDVLHATKSTKDRNLYNRLFYYSVVNQAGQLIDVSGETFKYLRIHGVKKNIYFQRHTVFDNMFIKKFLKSSIQNTYLKLPIWKGVKDKRDKKEGEGGKGKGEGKAGKEGGKEGGKVKEHEEILLSSGKNIDDKLDLRDIIHHFYRDQSEIQRVLCNDVFEAIDQVLEQNKLTYLKSRWYNKKMSQFLSTGVISLSSGNYCPLTKAANKKTHQNSTINFEISMDGVLYLRCSSCPNRLLQIVWRKKDIKNAGDPKYIKWNLFHEDYKFPDALLCKESVIKMDVKKYIESSNGKLEYISEELKKNDRGLANILQEIFDRRVKIVNQGNSTFIWNGKMWEEDESKKFHKIIAIYSHHIFDSVIEPLEQEISNFLRQIIMARITNNKEDEEQSKQSLKACEDKKKKYVSFREKLDKGQTKSVQDFLCNELYDGKFQSQVNKHPYYFAAENGMVNLHTQCLEGFNPKFYLTEACEYKFHPCSCPVGECTMDSKCDSECDLSFIHNTIKEIMAYDKELYDHLRWVIGYSLVGDPKKKKCLIGQGPKYNAKSLLSNLICDIIPMYCKTMNKSVVIDFKKGSENGHASHLTHLNGVRLAVLNETGQTERMNEDQMKSLTGGGDKKNVREAHASKAFDMDLGFVPFIFTNFAPKMSLNDEALWQRICPILFPVTFCTNPDPKKFPYENKMNEDLSNILRQTENKTKMFNWLVRCCVYYCQNQNKPYPEKINEVIKKYMIDCNELAQWLEENTSRYKFDPKRSMPLDDFRSDFTEFCKGRFTVSVRQHLLEHHYFNLMLKRLGLETETVGEKGKEQIMLKGIYCSSTFNFRVENYN